MPLFGQSFLIFPGGVHPTKAHTWENLDECKNQYEEFLADCDITDQTPCAHWIYIGEPDGDEEKYGYPDVPDYILEPKKSDPLIAEIKEIW